LGAAAFGFVNGRPASAQSAPPLHGTDFAPRAKRAIWLFMGGGPSQVDLFDYKPGLAQRFNEDLPASVISTQRLTSMTSGQSRLPIAPSRFTFQQNEQNGAWVSDLLPWTRRIAHELTIIKSVSTEAINHEPAVLAINTGSQLGGKPALGAWLAYALGPAAADMPAYAVMTSTFSTRYFVQSLAARLWGNAFLPSSTGGVVMRGVGDPVLYLPNPAGVSDESRRIMLAALHDLNETAALQVGDPSIRDRNDQYVMAFRMQRSVPGLTDVGSESAASLDLYGDSVHTPGTFAANCVAARRMLERGVRFVQIYHRGWDAHRNTPDNHRAECGDIDQACYGLITDLKARGMLEDTLVIWGGEFGRTVYCQGPLTREDYGRDHHPRCFTMWLAGGGMRPGLVHGETDDFSYNVVDGEVPLRDLHATILHLFGLDADRLTFRHSGLEERLVGVLEPAHVRTELLA
jgi:hypothetical protein